jgi:molybdenum cofactor cytidylyltransferase
MGRLKQLLPFGSKTVIETCVSNLLASNADQVIVVLGHRADEISQVLKSYNVRIVLNPKYQNGMGTSIAAGVNAVDQTTGAVMFSLVDQPSISTAIINSVVETYLGAPLEKRIVIPFYSGKGGHPTVFNISLKDELLNLDPSAGLRELKERRSDEVLYLDVDDPSVIEDMNYPEDYERQLARLKSRTGI